MAALLQLKKCRYDKVCAKNVCALNFFSAFMIMFVKDVGQQFKIVMPHIMIYYHILNFFLSLQSSNIFILL